jgi:hypothetical protein
MVLHSFSLGDVGVEMKPWAIWNQIPTPGSDYLVDLAAF